MKNIYVLTEGSYSDYYIVGVYSTKELAEDQIKTWTNEGDVVIDPFAGSGTLGRACKKMKRNYVLFDINPEAKEVFDKAS